MEKMECPYCHQMMEKGVIHGHGFALKWIEESRDKGQMISPFQRGIKLTDAWNLNELETYYCRNCQKMIFDVDKKDDII